MLCTASSHFVLDLCRRPFYGCARRLLFVHKETPGTRLCVQLAFWLFGPLLLAPTACAPGYKNRSNNAELFQKDLLSGAKAFARN